MERSPGEAARTAETNVIEALRPMKYGRRVCCLCFFALAVCWHVSPARAEEPPSSEALLGACEPVAGAADLVPVIVNGQVTDEFPCVGLFKTKTKPATATLIGPRTVLTAAHCIDDEFTHHIVLGGKEYEMESAHRHPEFIVNNGDLTRMDPLDRADHDLAIVRLKEAPPIAPAVLSRVPPRARQAIVVVGFGETALNRNDRGTKRRAFNFIERLTPNKFEFRGPQSVCHGDSGGPTFANFDGQLYLIGVHSVVSNPCGRFGVDMRVDFYREWIEKMADDVSFGPR